MSERREVANLLRRLATELEDPKGSSVCGELVVTEPNHVFERRLLEHDRKGRSYIARPAYPNTTKIHLDV